jgi:hypothetical protein
VLPPLSLAMARFTPHLVSNWLLAPPDFSPTGLRPGKPISWRSLDSDEVLQGRSRVAFPTGSLTYITPPPLQPIRSSSKSSFLLASPRSTLKLRPIRDSFFALLHPLSCSPRLSAPTYVFRSMNARYTYTIVNEWEKHVGLMQRHPLKFKAVPRNGMSCHV